MCARSWTVLGPQSSKILDHDGKPVSRGDSHAGERVEQFPRPLRSDEQRGSVGTRQENSLVSAGVQRAAAPRSADSPAAVLAQGRIFDRLREGDLRQRDAGFIEKTI